MTNMVRDMKDYYKERKTIQELFHNDVLYGDLPSSLLSIRDKIYNISSMTLEIQSLHIRIILAQPHSTEEEKKMLNDINSIYAMITKILNNYIYNSIDKVASNIIAENIKKNIEIGIQYFDINYVGNIIEIYL